MPASSVPRSPRAYVPELDGLRALAITCVLCAHWLPASSLTNRLLLNIPWGVYLFFVLSGFLITRILVRCRADVDAGRTTRRAVLTAFYARRFLRLLPLYYMVLAVGVACNCTNVRATLPWHAAFLSNVYYFRHHGFDRGPAAVFWTLAVEEQFYLLWPALVLLVPRRRLGPCLLAVAALGTAFGCVAIGRGSQAVLLMPACVPFLALGGYLSLDRSSSQQAGVLRAYAVAAGSLAFAAVSSWGMLHAGPVRRGLTEGLFGVVIALVFARLVHALASGSTARPARLLRLRPLLAVGQISYGLFLFQFFVSGGLDQVVPLVASRTSPAVAGWMLQSFATRFAVTAALATLSWRCLEKPLADLKRHFPYAPRRAPLVPVDIETRLAA